MIHMVMYFADQVVPVSNGDVLGIDTALFGDILQMSDVATLILDIKVGDAWPTPQLLAMIHSGSNKPMAACLKRDATLNPFDAISTHRSTRSVSLNDSMDDSRLI